MGKIEILVYLADQEHAQAICRYVSAVGTNLKMSLLAGEEEARAVMQEDKLLLSDMVMPGRYIYLSESRDEKPDYGAGRVCVYKYLPADVLIDELIYQIQALAASGSEQQGAPVRTEKRDAKLIAFISGMGGAGRSVTAIATGRALAGCGGRVLYLNLEPVNASAVYSGRAPDMKLRSVSDYAYMVLSGRPVCSEKGFTYCDHEGLRYFYEEEGLNPLAALRTEEMQALILHLIEEAAYDYILADLPGVFSPAEACLLECCGRVLLMGDASPVSCWKNRRLLQLINRERSEPRPFWFREVVNRPADGGAVQQENAFYIQEQRGAFRHTGENTEILPHTGFTKGVQEISRWIQGGWHEPAIEPVRRL